jgi:hypothetical protein
MRVFLRIGRSHMDPGRASIRNVVAEAHRASAGRSADQGHHGRE